MIKTILLLLCLAVGHASAFAGTGAVSSGAAPQLTGVWLTQVTIRHCVTDAVLAGPFPGLITYHAGGTVSEVGPALPMSTRSPAHGLWRRAGPHSYVVDVIFQRYDLGGMYLGTQTIRGEPVIDLESGTYTARGSFLLHDVTGAQVGAGCSQVVGRRFE